jgi:hypothetical protein
VKTRTWILIFSGLLLVSLAAWLLLPKLADKSSTVGVYQDGKLLRTIDLSKVTETSTFSVTGAAGTNVVEASPGSIRVIEAGCPDKICVKHGPLKTGGRPIICLPNRLVIKWLESQDAPYDAVAGGAG